MKEREISLGLMTGMPRPHLFSAHVDGKQCRDSFQQPHFCYPSLALYSVAFRSNFIRSLLLDLNPYGGEYDPDGCFQFLALK